MTTCGPTNGSHRPVTCMRLWMASMRACRSARSASAAAAALASASASLALHCSSCSCNHCSNMDAKHRNSGRDQLDCAMLGPVILWCVSSSASTLFQSRERWRSLRICALALRKAHLQALGQGFCGRRCRAARLRRPCARVPLCPRRRRVVHAPPPHVFSLCHLHCHDCIRRSVTLLCRTLLWNT